MRNKKWLVLLIVSALCLLCACGGGSASSETAASESAVASESQQEVSSAVEVTEAASEQAASSEIVENPNADFRNACWGDSMETVKANEKIELAVADNGMMGTSQVGGYDANVVYLFSDDKLYEGIYAITEEYSSGAYYINHYDDLKEKLTSKYGEPESDEIIKLEKDSLIEMAGDGNALEYGYVAYRTIWETDTTKIMMGMLSENYDITWLVSYIDVNYEEAPNTEGL